MEVRGRIVVVGCGSIGRRHARILAQRTDVALELCEPQRESLELSLSEVGARPTYDSFEQMLTTKPEMVVIATPHAMHADQTVAALHAGAHVLCEKPMSDTVANARRMIEAIEQSDRVLSIGFTLHYHPAMRRIKELVASGRFGTVLHVHWHIGTYITLINSVSRHQAEVEGALLMDYAHQPDLVYWWLGEMPTAVYAAGFQAGDLELQSNPNIIAVTIEYDKPLLSTINLNYVQYPDRGDCEIIGDKGWVRFDFEGNRLTIGQHATEATTHEVFTLERDSMYVAEQQAFFDAIDGKRTPESPASEAVVSMQIIEAAIKSWREQRRMPITDGR